MRKHMSVLLSLVLVASLFTGCAKKTNEDAAAAAGGAEATQKEITTRVVPGDETIPNPAKDRANAKDTLVVGMSEAKGEFLPVYYSTTYDGQVVKLIYDSLYNNDEKGEYVPLSLKAMSFQMRTKLTHSTSKRMLSSLTVHHLLLKTLLTHLQ